MGRLGKLVRKYCRKCKIEIENDTIEKQMQYKLPIYKLSALYDNCFSITSRIDLCSKCQNEISQIIDNWFKG